MQLLSIKNIFEYYDKKIDGVKENLLKNINQLQGLGVPDICIITKQYPVNLIKSSLETLSSFHFVQGLCPKSQADVFAYLQTILQNQEREKQTLFSKSQSITKLTYLCYDIFSRFLVCEIQLQQQKKSNVFMIQENQKVILPTNQHWQGVYLSNILRAIDEDFKFSNVGRFYNNINLKNDVKLGEMISSLLELITINTKQFQDFDKISSNQFCDIHDVLHYLCWPLDILVSYLTKSNQLFILLNELENIKNNVIFCLVKSIIFYKMKQYQRSLYCLVNINQNYQQFNLIKYLSGKVLIKQGKFQQAFLILQDTLINSYENQIVWIALASIFRKQNNYQVCLSLLNKAADLKELRTKKLAWLEMHLSNYRVLTQDHSITHLDDLDKMYTLINPIEVDQVESFSQLNNHPRLEQLLIRLRILDKKQLKLWYFKAQKSVNNQAYKIEQHFNDLITQNQLLENKNKLSGFQKEIIKLSIQVGHKQLQKYLQQYFYSQPNCSSSSYDIDQITEIIINQYQNTFLIIIILIKHVSKLDQKIIKETTIFLKRYTPASLNELDSEEEDQPQFLKQNLNKSFDFSNTAQQTQYQNSKEKPQNTKISKQIFPKYVSQTYQVIQENTFESVESQRDDVHQFKGIGNLPLQNNKIIKNLNEKRLIKKPRIQIYGLIDHLSNNNPQLRQIEIGDSIKRKKDNLNPLLKEFIDYISQTQNVLDELFYNSNQVINAGQQQYFHSSEKQTPKKQVTQIFKSSLKDYLKNKNYQQKQIDLKDFYTIYGFSLNFQDEQQAYNQFTKQESTFLFNCSRIANKLKQYNLEQKILQKINDRVISIQVFYSLLHIYKDDHTQLIQLIQQILMDFLVCGISKTVSIPIWIEIHLIKLIKLKGCNYVLGLLCAVEDYDTFQLMKKIVLQTENLL